MRTLASLEHDRIDVHAPEGEVNGVVAALSAAVATVSLFLTAASLLAAPVGGVIFTPFLFGLFLLALVGVFSGLENRTVRRYNPPMNPRRWRDPVD
jgi:hypothetical protein